MPVGQLSKARTREEQQPQAQTGRERAEVADPQDLPGPLCPMSARATRDGSFPADGNTETRHSGASFARCGVSEVSEGVCWGSWVLSCSLNFSLRETARTWIREAEGEKVKGSRSKIRHRKLDTS